MDEITKLETRKTSFDDTEPTICFTVPGQRWNGWIMPFLTITSVSELFGGTYMVHSDSDFVYLGLEGVRFPKVQIPLGAVSPEWDGLDVYDFRSGGFCFNDDGEVSL